MDYARYFNEPVNAVWIMLINREVVFMTSISVFPKKHSRSFAIELARQLL